MHFFSIFLSKKGCLRAITISRLHTTEYFIPTNLVDTIYFATKRAEPWRSEASVVATWQGLEYKNLAETLRLLEMSADHMPEMITRNCRITWSICSSYDWSIELIAARKDSISRSNRLRNAHIVIPDNYAVWSSSISPVRYSTHVHLHIFRFFIIKWIEII